MTNEQLRNFIAVVEHGTFRKAARAIYKSQASISAAVKALEDEIDLKLFSREGYRPELTEAGRAFYQRARLVMNHFNGLDIMARQLAAGVEARFSIVLSSVCPMPFLLERIKQVTALFPHTRFKVDTEVLSGVNEKIDRGLADVGFGPNMGLDASHEKRLIGQFSLVNVAAPGYLPIKENETMSAEDIRHYSQIVLRDTGTNPVEQNYFVIEEGDSWNVGDYGTKRELTVAGLGWGRLPGELIKNDLADGRLVPINVEGIPTCFTGDLYIFRRRDRVVGPVAERMWQQFQEEKEPA